MTQRVLAAAFLVTTVIFAAITYVLGQPQVAACLGLYPTCGQPPPIREIERTGGVPAPTGCPDWWCWNQPGPPAPHLFQLILNPGERPGADEHACSAMSWPRARDRRSREYRTGVLPSQEARVAVRQALGGRRSGEPEATAW